MIRALILPLMEIVKRIQRRRLRQMMRGYRKLKSSGRLDRIATVKQILAERPLSLINVQLSSNVMGCGASAGELVIRQYLLARFGSISLNRALLRASRKIGVRVVFPLPREWREIVAQQGFEVASFRSALLWQFYVVAALLYGIVKIGKIALDGMKTSNYSQWNPKPHVYFADLASGNLPHETHGKQSYDLLSWYLQWQGRRPDIQAIHHSVANSVCKVVGDTEIVQLHGPLPALAGLGSVAKFLLWAVRAVVIAAIDLLRGRWWYALLLNQAALAAQVRYVPTASLAKEYLFNISGLTYRPLWTYETEQRGAMVSLYFYSTNCERFKRIDGYPPMSYEWKVMNWPRYLVWDEYQADFVRRAVGYDRSIAVVGPIWFHSRSAEMPKLSRRSVAVFDITPHRASRYCTLGAAEEFYVPEVANPFCEHVSKVIQRLNVLMLWKKKRKIGRIAHPHYRHLTDQIAKGEHVVLVDPDMAANLVIESSVAVISMPFTSTALIAREMGKPSVYYDPTGLVQKDDRAAHGIEILSGLDELEDWLSVVLEK